MTINLTAMTRVDSNISGHIPVGIGALFLVGNLILHRFVQNMEEEEEVS